MARIVFEDNGWTAIREVSPHRSRYSADLLVQHDTFGWIGIEGKYFDGEGGAKIAEAHHQITRKYRGKKYIRNRVDLWAICPYFGRNSPGYMKVMRELFSRHGIGHIELSRSELLIDFNYSDSSMKIPVGGDRTTRYVEAVDIEKIRANVQRKRDKYDYNPTDSESGRWR